MGLPQLLDQRQLALQPVRVVLFAFQDRGEQIPAAVVTSFDAERDARVQTSNGLLLEDEGQRQLLDGALAGPYGAEALEVGVTLEVEQPLNEMVGVLHLVDRLGAETLGKPFVAPVVEHLRIEEVL